MNNQIVDRPLREDGPVHAASEAHVALSLVLDVSGSMSGTPILHLNDAVNQMIREMKADDRLSEIVDLSIFIFGTRDRQVIHQGFRAIADCETIDLQATDVNTYVADALNRAMDVTRNRCSIYDKGGGSYKPWIVLITDGEFHDDAVTLASVANKLKERESNGKLNFFGLGVEGYKREQVEQLTNNPGHVIDVKTANFVEFFKWVGKSLKTVSTKAVGESVELPPLVFKV